MSVGIKETQELISGISAVAVSLVSAIKKAGVVAGSLEVVDLFLNDEEFKSKLIAAIQNVHAIPAEASDLDFAESLELAKQGIAFVTAVVAASKSVPA